MLAPTVPFEWRARLPGWRVVVLLAIGVIAMLPAAWTLAHAMATSRNIAYWDEIDSVLPLLLQLKEGMSVDRFFAQLFAVTNEHRTVTSRLLFAVSYWLTGTVNFGWLAAIGNAFLVGACALLVRSVSGVRRRLTLAVLLGFVIFHLGHYESFLWSGSSIDHFQVLPLAIGALFALRLRRPIGLDVARGCGVLASFTLAHGLLVWPVGALVLTRERRWRDLIAWSVAALVVGLVYFHDFEFNGGHHIATSGVATLRWVLTYWLKLLGAPVAFGHAGLSVAGGAVLLAVVIRRSFGGRWARERAQLPVLWFLLGSGLLVAFGRAELAHGHIFSRYLILGGLAWTLVIFEALNHGRLQRRPFLTLAAAIPLLALFNCAQNVRWRSDAATFVEHRDRAALRFRQHGEDGRAPVTLHPNPARATEMLTSAARQGVYRMPALCEERAFPEARTSTRMNYCLDEFTLNARAAYLAGWVTLPETTLQRGQIHVILRSAERSLVFTAVPVRRPDVVKAFGQPDWEWSGFRFSVQRASLPPGVYSIGFLFAGESPELVMTEHRLDLTGAGAAIMAKAE